MRCKRGRCRSSWGAGSGDEEPGAGGDSTVPAHTRFHGVCRIGLVAERRFPFVLSFVRHARFPFFCNPLGVRSTSSWDGPGRRAKGSLQRAATARTADW